ncbi:MAG: biopolymer transporter ExbD [Bacteroidetes bacterium]|nr:biopolymer transporter ExbD [Bacteroidota bacterium]
MGLRKKAHREAEVSTDSLNDIMFFLLLFFLILSTMVSPNARKVNLPSDHTTETVQNNKKPVHLAVTSDRKYYVDNQEVDFGSLESVISPKIAGMAEPTIVMHLDKDLNIQDLTDVMQICDRLHCKPILATKSSNGK